MQKQLTILCLFIALATQSKAQVNLVPNGSFEDTVQCPTFQDQANRAHFWSNPTAASPDFFSSNYCNQFLNSDIIDVPSNIWGYQFAKTGSNYMGIAVIFPDTSTFQGREYLQVSLIEPLKPNQHYEYEFYVSLADDLRRYATKSIGIKVSSDSLFEVFTGQLYTNVLSTYIDNQVSNYLTDTISWQKVQGCFMAQGGEKFLIIGSFGKHENQDYIVYDTTAEDLNGALYYIDDVSLFEIDGTCTAGIKQEQSFQISIFPNPAAENVTITLPPNTIKAELLIYTVQGQLLSQTQLTGTQTINTSNLANGLYLFVIQSNGNVVGREKAIIAH